MTDNEPARPGEQTPWWARPWANLPRSRVRRFTPRSALLLVLAATATVGALGFTAWDRPYPQTRPGPALSTEYVQSSNALSAGCSGIFEFPHHPQTGPVERTREDGSARHIRYTVRVPAFGPYFTENPSSYTAANRFRPATHADPLQPEEGLGLAIEDGWTIVWYSPDAPDVDVRNAVAWLEQHSDAKVIVAEWSGDRELPRGRSFGFTAQNVSQSCARFAGFTLQEFLDFTVTHQGTPTPDLPRAWENNRDTSPTTP